MSRFKLPQKVTYWIASGVNTTGGKTWNAPISTAARIANISKLIFTPQGKQQHATRAIYTRDDIPLGAYVVEGEITDAAPTSEAQQVIFATNNATMSDMNKALV